MSITHAVISETTGATNFAGGAWGYGTTITVSPGVSRLVVLAGCHGSAANISGVRLGGDEATTFVANNNGYNRSAAAATFSSPAAGTVAIRARFGASVGANVSLVVIEVFGDDPSALRTSTSISRQLVTSAPITLSSTASGDRVFAVAVEQSVGAMSASAPAVEEYQAAPGGTDAASFVSQDGDDTSTTVTWTSGANARFVLVGVALMPSSGPSPAVLADYYKRHRSVQGI